MNYKSVFAVANENLKLESDYILKNYDYYEPKLDKEFYYKYFSKELFFEVNILNIEEFLDFHFYKSSNPDLFIKLIERKILPSLKNIVSNAELDFLGGPYSDKKLKDGFVESDGLIFNRDYEMYHFYHITALDKLVDDLNERLKIIINYVETANKLLSNENPSLLFWKGKLSHLAYIIRELVDCGYIEPPRRLNGEINLTQLSKDIIQSINSKEQPSIDTFRRYLDADSKKHKSLIKSFDKQGFKMPLSKNIS